MKIPLPARPGAAVRLGAVLVFPLAAAFAADNSSPPTGSDTAAVKLAPFEITAERTGGYNVSSATTASRTNTPVIDIPQSVDVVTSAFWNDRGATTFDESFKYVANIYVRNRHASGGNIVNLRGFQAGGSVMIDGIRLAANFKHNLVGYDRLEVIKGPASAVQGRAGGSGVLNFILKKPELAKRRTWVRTTIGSDDNNGRYLRAEFDSNFAAGQGGQFAARVAGAVQQSDDYIEFQESNVTTIYPSFRWRISPRTELVLASEFLRQLSPSREEGHGFQLHPYRLRRLIPMFDTPRDPITALRLPDNFNPAGPGNVDHTRVAATTLFLTHQFTPALSYRQAAHWRYVADDQQNYTAPAAVVTRVASVQATNKSIRHNVTVQGDLIDAYTTPFFSGHTLVGYNYGRTTGSDVAYQGTPNAPFNFIDLAALAASGNRASYFEGRTVARAPLTQSSTTAPSNLSTYANQGLDFFAKRLLLTGGLRREHDISTGTNVVTGRPTARTSTWLNSWLYGATYKVTRTLSIYGVVSMQYDASSTRAVYSGLPAGDPRNNEYLTVQPLTRLKEIGVKSELLGGRLSGSVDYWQMTREGGTQTLSHLSDSLAPDYSKVIEVKGAESKGFEVSVYGEITRHLNVVANYTRMTTSQQDTITNTLNRIPGLFAPKWGLNVWGKYDFFESRGQGWQLKGGVSFIGPIWTTLTGFTGQFEVPRTQKSIDAGVGYRWRRYDVDFMVNNLANDPFLITRDQPTRNYRLSVSTQF